MVSYWIWFFGDFEIYHAMKQNFSREERGYDWPSYWHNDTWNMNVKFMHSYYLSKKESIHVYSRSIGYVKVNELKYPLNCNIDCGPGQVDIEIITASMTDLPAVFVEGESICSDSSWTVSNYIETVPAGFCELYKDLSFDPNEIHFSSEIVACKDIKDLENGVLIDFGKMIDGLVSIEFSNEDSVFDLCFGESIEEATDVRWCYYKEQNYKNGKKIRKRAFRFVFIPYAAKEEIKDANATHLFIDIPVRSSFKCDNNELNRIWDVAIETYRLCSGLFFIDGIKRDRWIWSGDAYQSYFINPYVFSDKSIEQRTILALRGNSEINQHLNTIVDYSLLWLISIEKHIREYDDVLFLSGVWTKIQKMMDFCDCQLDNNGFIVGRPGDWIFIDWAEMDKEGPIVSEQMLLLAAYNAMAFLSEKMKISNDYSSKAIKLKEKINQYYWNKEKGAFIDSFQSGKNSVTRHGNIFSILFGIANDSQTDSIIKNVLLCKSVPEITTPYFKFFELDALGKIGRFDLIWDQLFSYWGGMLKEGAITFWEQYDPTVKGTEHYAMYGDPFGKSLCHAWSASPIYFIGKYLIGLRMLSAQEIVLNPRFDYIKELNCVFPVGENDISLKLFKQKLIITTTLKSGKLYLDNDCYDITDGTPLEIEL